MKALLAGAALLLVLSGCTLAQKAIVGQAISIAQDSKDTEAEVLKAALCAISVGAYHRLNTASEKQAIDTLCGGEVSVRVHNEWERDIIDQLLKRSE